MNTQDNINYNRIAEAIDYIRTNFKQQPDLDEAATQTHWLHRLPPTKRITRPRVNLTFRTIVENL